MGVRGQRKAAQSYLEKPVRILYMGGGIAAFGLIALITGTETNICLGIMGFGALYCLLYFPWKKKHDEKYGKDK